MSCWPALFAGEALEVGHLALHFLAGGVGGGADALDAQAEFVWIGRARQGLLESDELFAVQIEERLIEGLHAVLAGAGGDGVVNEASFVRVDDAIANIGGGDHDLDRGDAAGVVGAADEALRDDGLERGGHLQTNLFLLGGRKDGNDTLNGFGGVESVQRGENEVAGFGGEERGGNGFEVAHFADQDDVRILTKRSAQGSGEIRGVDFDFALIDETALVTVQELDGVFDGDEVIGAIGVDAVDHGGEGRGFTGTRGAGHEYQSALLFADAIDDRRKIELVGGADFRGNDAKDHADVAALLEHVDAEAAEAGDAIGHVELGGLLKLLLLAVGHHAEGHGQHFFRRDARDVSKGSQEAIDAQIGVVADFEMQVGGFVFDGAAEQIVNIEGQV
jgi:hypothetical protein